MAGTKAGGYKACATNKRKYGNDWYAKIGKIGGSKTGLKGFALNNELAKSAGRKGGLKSRRGPESAIKMAQSNIHMIIL